MWESFFGFKKTPFTDSPDAKQLFAPAAWRQVKTTAARVFTASLNPNLYKIYRIRRSNNFRCC